MSVCTTNCVDEICERFANEQLSKSMLREIIARHLGAAVPTLGKRLEFRAERGGLRQLIICRIDGEFSSSQYTDSIDFDRWLNVELTKVALPAAPPAKTPAAPNRSAVIRYHGVTRPAYILSNGDARAFNEHGYCMGYEAGTFTVVVQEPEPEPLVTDAHRAFVAALLPILGTPGWQNKALAIAAEHFPQ